MYSIWPNTNKEYMYKHTWSNYYILQYKTKYTNVNWFKMLEKKGFVHYYASL